MKLFRGEISRNGTYQNLKPYKEKEREKIQPETGLVMVGVQYTTRMFALSIWDGDRHRTGEERP